MPRRLIIVTVGFEEQLPLRGIMRIGVTREDEIALVYVQPSGRFESEKVQRALSFLESMLQGVNVESVRLALSGRNIVDDVRTVSRLLTRHLQGKDQLIAVLVGGMRILIPIVLLATQAVTAIHKVKALFLFMREDGLYDFTLGLEAFQPPKLTGREKEVLAITYKLGLIIERYRAVKEISTTLDVTEAMAYRWLDALTRKGLLVEENTMVKFTPLGVAVAEALKQGDEHDST